MSGNKTNARTKSKEDKNKNNKNLNQTNDESEDIDFSLLRKPVHTSITGFAQARKIFDLATEELKDLVSNECDLLYECKVCRNIFRSLANFISHKRVYCKERFSISVHGHFINPTSTANEILKIKHIEEGYQESLKAKSRSEYMDTDEPDERIPLTKDLTTIVEKITKTRGASDGRSEEQQVVLQKIPNSSVAVFQNVNLNDEEHCDNMRTQIKELDTILSHDKAVLQNDGKFKIQSAVGTDPDTVIQISDDDDNADVLKCKICDLQFSTQKTLKFHMKYKHLESRLVYPCPDCLEIFSTSWSVYRHLFKVHRKTAAQIRRLRESIQAKAFRMNNPPAFYEKKKNNMKPAVIQKITEEERLDQENQAWMDNMECDGELPRCGGCGRTFERRAALAAHTHYCQPRSRALARRAADNRRIEIQIRKDYNKATELNSSNAGKSEDADDIDPVTSPPQSATETQSEDQNNECEEAQHDKTLVNKTDDNKTPNDAQCDVYKSTINLPFARLTEQNNFVALKQKVKSDVDLEKLLCKKCDNKFNQSQELYDHMAGHYKWVRYACKLCNFKHYDFEKLPEHVKIVHKLKGDTDFYYSTIKAIDGNEASELSECTEELNDANGSPDSRRPSRCSSDSSRLSDDSSSSSTRIEAGARKRKMYQSKSNSKRKKESPAMDDGEEQKDVDVPIDKVSILGENESSSSIKTFEENSSDIDDTDDKTTKKQTAEYYTSVASRRPIRKKTKLKNEDFEYDLSNLLKMEAQGYRDSISVASTKSTPSKKKPQQDIQLNYNILIKEHSGSCATMAKKTAEKSKGFIKSTNFAVYGTKEEQRVSNIFVRPMLPKIISRGEKTCSKKDIEDVLDATVQNKQSKPSETASNFNKDIKIETNSTDEQTKYIKDDSKTIKVADNSNNDKRISPVCETVKANINIPAVVPIKFRRQSLEVIKNPLINKNITDFTKAGMKTKILVIKPINRNKDGSKALNALKFQTIKLKDPNKVSSSIEDKSSDKVVLVKVPKVECAISQSVSDAGNTKNEGMAPTPNTNITNKNNTSDSKQEALESSETSYQSIVKTESETNTNGKYEVINPVKTNNTTVPHDIEAVKTNSESIVNIKEPSIDKDKSVNDSKSS